MKEILLLLIYIQDLRISGTTSVNEVDKQLDFEEQTTSPSAEIFNDTNVIRKCCPSGSYHSTVTNECSATYDDNVFLYHVNELMNYFNWNIVTYSQRINTCPDTYQKPDIKSVTFINSQIILEDGEIYDYDLNTSFSRSHYCLEMVGDSIDSSSVVLVYCLGQLNTVPKCCPQGEYFDTRGYTCSKYYNDKENIEDSSLMKYLHKDATISFDKGLVCDDLPYKVRLDETYFDHSFLCLIKTKQCYNTNEFCIDNMLINDYGNELAQSAFVCPYNFINKCCPEGQSLYKRGCTVAPAQSLSLAILLSRSMYHVKSGSILKSDCHPVILEDNLKSDIQWTTNVRGDAIIRTVNESIVTRKYCIDDFADENDISPVLKVCSEEVKVYHAVASITDYPDNVIGKCCPINQYYSPKNHTGNNSQCFDQTDRESKSLEQEIFQWYNISQLVFTEFPLCSITKYYHIYDLQHSYGDYAEITEQRHLNIIRKENNCIRKVSQVNVFEYCIDFVATENHAFKAVAITCAGRKDYHPERNIIVMSLVGISCAALILTFLILIFVRVRRGMVTVKKINTLPGRILTSYVLSQLISYVILGVGTFADFGEETAKCFVLAGFLIFFTISSFCWNTSVCMEGLLLTMNAQISGTRRYIYHFVWALGFPGIMTAATLIIDSKRNELSCDVITPKIGVERCFFSDPLAQLLYFYLPISITVIMNAIFLVSAKLLRKSKLKNLEKDPNRVRRHENLHKVLSIKSIRSKIRRQSSVKSKSTHSGLRTHHNRSMWIESLKLVLWSGTTWLMEIIGTLVIIYRGRSYGEWYNYIWYLPVGFNCLRGLGVFAIITFNEENKIRFLRSARLFTISVNTTFSKIVPSLQFGSSSKRSQNNSNKSTNGNAVPFSSQKDSLSPPKNAFDQRSISESTIITNISSSFHCNESAGEILEANSLKIAKFCHSVSQDDSASINNSNQPDVLDHFEESVKIEKLRNGEEASLDNTSMENVFWEDEFQVKRNSSNYRGQNSSNNNNDGIKDNFYAASPVSTKSTESNCDIEPCTPKQRYFFEDFDFCTHL